MKSIRLSNEEAASSGFTHKAIVTYADLTALGATTSGVVVLGTYTAGTLFSTAAYKIVTNFDGGATSTMTMSLGWNGATTDDDDGSIAAAVVHEDGTEVPYGDGTGAAFATLRTGYAALDAGNLEAKFVATGGNLDALTQGEVHLFWRQTDLTKF